MCKSVFELMHKSVKLKSKIDGIIIGFYQEKKENSMQFLVEYWAEGSKKQNWYYSEDFSLND